ncbi:MAG TPA: hypothetical protein VGC57_03650, partial [Cellulomonas sp.]
AELADGFVAEPLTSHEILSTQAGVLYPGQSHRAYRAQGIVALAESDGTVVLVTTGTEGAESPLYLVRCTAGECVTAQTTISRWWATTYSGGAVGVGPDGTVYAVIDNAGPAGNHDTGLVLATLSPAGDLSTQFLPESGDETTYTSAQGVSLAVGPDGTAWVLHLASPGRTELIRCDDATCSSRATSTHAEIEQGMAVLAVDSTGRPLIATPDRASGGVSLLGCSDRDCADLAEVRLWTAGRGEAVGVSERHDEHVALALALDGELPVIVVADPHRLAGGDRIIRCATARCGAG